MIAVVAVLVVSASASAAAAPAPPSPAHASVVFFFFIIPLPTAASAAAAAAAGAGSTNKWALTGDALVGNVLGNLAFQKDQEVVALYVAHMPPLFGPKEGADDHDKDTILFNSNFDVL